MYTGNLGLLKNAVMKWLGLIILFISIPSSGQEAFPKPVKTYGTETKVDGYDFATFENILHLEDDTTYVINFWATWCVPCVTELPFFEELGVKYKNRKVEVILVSLDMEKQVESRLIPFIRKKGLKSKVVFLKNTDSGEWIGKVDPTWSGALPATIIYNKGKRKFMEQSFTYESLEAELQPFIN